MEPYQKWPEENYPKKCPVHNCYVFHPSNSQNYKQNPISYIVQQKPKIIQAKNLNNNYQNRQYNIYTQNIESDPSSLLKEYQSTDGVLRGYNNNYSFYISGSSKVKSNVTINNHINNYTTQTMGQYPYQNKPIQTSKNSNSSYLILEKEPIIYNYNTNYNTNNINGFNYNQIQNKNINPQQKVYQAPKIEKRTVKRIADKETKYASGPKDNYRNNINTVRQNQIYEKTYANIYSTKKYNRNQIINRKNPTPGNQRSHIITSNNNRPGLSQRQRQFYNPNAIKNNNSISYENRPYQYRVYTEQNDYQPYANYSKNNCQKNNYYISSRQRGYTSQTQYQEQGNLNYEFEKEDYEEEDENEDEEDIYEVPVQYNKNNYNNNIKREMYQERPFMRINSNQRNGRRYGAYTQTLAMNGNYYMNELEYDPNNGRYIDNNNYYYSLPKYGQEKYGKRYPKEGNEVTSFQKSLRNIRLNNEEIEMENEQRNKNRVKIRTSGADNHRLYISNNTDNNLSRKNYRTYTEQNAYRNQDYILHDLDDEDYNYINRNKYHNLQKKENNDYYNYNNEEEIENDEESEEEKMYDTHKLIRANEDNFKIIHQKVNKNENNKNKQQTEEDDLYKEEEMPYDGDEIPKKKKVKNIETEINEKYYDNQGNYLGEKKIITTKQIPITQKAEINLNQEEDNNEEQEEFEEYESENGNYLNTNENDEYIPYKANNKHYKKRGENNKYKIKEKPSKYHSYFGDSTNNVYYESKPDNKDTNYERKKININTNVINNKNIQIVNSNLGIQSENMCVPAEENNDNEDKDKESNINNEENEENDNDEKEADEQQIEENEVFNDDEEPINENNNEINKNENDQREQINEKDNDERNLDDKDEKNENENLNERGDMVNENKEDNMKEEIQKEENAENDVDLNKNEDEDEDIHEENNQQNYNEDNNNENNIDNHINDEEEQNIEENGVEEIENQNIQNEEEGEEYVGEEEYDGEEEYIGEEMINNEYENNEQNYEDNNEQEYGEEEGLDEEENEHYEN